VIVFFLLFAGVDYYIVQVQHQTAKHIVYHYLDRVRIEGFLATADEIEMKDRLKSVGLPVEDISGPRQSNGDDRVLRNPQNPDASRITMVVTCRPTQRPLVVGLLIGGKAASDSFRIRVGGTVLSERVDP
jgi:hypothetical protein